MKRTIVGGFAAVLLAAGCATGVKTLDMAAVSDAIVQGYATYEQIQALKDKAKEAEGSVEAPAASDGTFGGSGTAVKPAETEAQANVPPVVPAAGKAVAVFLGNRATCSYCKKLAALNPEPYIETALPAVDWIDADKTLAPADYAKYRPKTGFSYPFIRVYDASGVFKGEFTARNMTLEKIAAKIKEVCPSCAD